MTTSVTSRPSSSPDVGLILATIRQEETGSPAGNYSSSSSSSTASGAYQYLDTSWNGYGGYRRAKDAPPAVQDQRAQSDVLRILQSHGGDVSAVPWNWYYPASGGNPNIVPPGNSLSVGEYVARWMHMYNAQGGQGGSSTVVNNAVDIGNVELASSTKNESKEHCLIHPKLSLPGFLPNVDFCLVSSNTGRAIAGALLVGIGGSIMLAGVSLLVLGKMPPNPAVGFINDAQERKATRTSNQLAALAENNNANAPRTSGGGKRMLARPNEEPF